MHQPPSNPSRRFAPAGHALAATLIGLLLGSLLNARALETTARNLPIGPERSIAVAITGSLRAVSSFLFLDRPRLGLDALLGRSGTLEPTTPEPDTNPVAVTQPTTTTTTASAAFRLPTPTEDDPLRVWIIGDSLMELLGPSLVNASDESGIVDAEIDFRFVSGLTRKDFFDWPAHATEQLPVVQPDLVIAMFGGNDGQDVNIDGVLTDKFTPAWIEFYHGRVAEAMDVFTGTGSRVYWIGLPVMRNEVFSGHAEEMNQVYAEEANKRPMVKLIDSWDLFTDENGEYAAYLTNAEGNLELMRYGDGVHFTWAGARRLAALVFETMAEDWSR